MCRFWSLLDSYCPSGQPYSLPVVSSFGRGCGEMLCVDGTIVQHGHWSNLSAQDLQPSFFSSTMLKNHPKVLILKYMTTLVVIIMHLHIHVNTPIQCIVRYIHHAATSFTLSAISQAVSVCAFFMDHKCHLLLGYVYLLLIYFLMWQFISVSQQLNISSLCMHNGKRSRFVSYRNAGHRMIACRVKLVTMCECNM